MLLLLKPGFQRSTWDPGDAALCPLEPLKSWGRLGDGGCQADAQAARIPPSRPRQKAAIIWEIAAEVGVVDGAPAIVRPADADGSSKARTRIQAGTESLPTVSSHGLHARCSLTGSISARAAAEAAAEVEAEAAAEVEADAEAGPSCAFS